MSETPSFNPFAEEKLEKTQTEKDLEKAEAELADMMGDVESEHRMLMKEGDMPKTEREQKLRDQNEQRAA